MRLRRSTHRHLLLNNLFVCLGQVSAWLLCCAIITPAWASNFTVRVDTPFVTGGPYAVTDSGPLEAEAYNKLSGNHIWEAYGYAGPTVLRGMADAWSAGDFFYNLSQASSDSRMMLDDVIFTSSGSDPISVTLNLHLSGEFIRSGVNNTDEITINKVLIGVEYGGGLNNGEYRVTDSFDGGGLSETSSGLLSGLSGDIINETIQVTRSVPVNTPVGLNLTLLVEANASKFTCRATTDFSNSFGFVQGANVFDVPEGVTVNSVSGGIVDNMVIPEPSALCLASLAGLLYCRSRR